MNPNWTLCDKGDYADFQGESRVILADDRRLAVVHSGSEGDKEMLSVARKMAAAGRMAEAISEVLIACPPMAFTGPRWETEVVSVPLTKSMIKKLWAIKIEVSK